MKIVIVGSSTVGKSSIVTRLVNGEFVDDAATTCGADFYTYNCMLNNEKVKLQIWDTAGQERFRSISKSYFRNAVGAILVYDLTNLDSFDQLTDWLSDLHALCAANAYILLVGNKSDLISERQVSNQQIQEFAEHHHLESIETSAKTGRNITEAFTRLTYEVLSRINRGEIQVSYAGIENNVKIENTTKDDQYSCC
ncbi:Ras family protein [Tritrichomonas foetus]|uniref:Ras family protein n=1 Tax=Tritrichomonas foetus TaxID=1144522 RepID=A0A1J4KI54_9EUKA|nr:Ras family protein [Tritrichomonas foetus]|eukprot:OHT09342.1 Ras family protein [Tritrichomonas foetus]